MDKVLDKEDLIIFVRAENLSEQQISDLIGKTTSASHLQIWLISEEDDEELNLNSLGYQTGYMAEDASSYRPPNSNRWEIIFETKDKSWKEVAGPIFDFFLERTPGTILHKHKARQYWVYSIPSNALIELLGLEVSLRRP